MWKNIRKKWQCAIVVLGSMEVMLSLTAVQLCRCHLLCRSTPYSSLPKPSPISPFLGCLLTNCVALLCQYCKLSRGPPSAQKPGLFDANKVSWPAIGFCLLSMMLSIGKKLVKPGTVIKGRISTIPQFDEFLSHTALTASHTAQNECHCPRLYGDIFLLVLPSVDEFLSQYFSMLRRDIRASLLCRKRACLSLLLELLWRVWIKYMGFKRTKRHFFQSFFYFFSLIYLSTF